ncbi:hypothetical protein LPJ78_000656 [Coemansia sp. RSA 989]|nr:hypothetical protein BX667DRAFT_514355 [Coemansia mojavensis]KAJ1744138.1 hypothetical protein LPJ68_000368 [Coemansia sp. RSA 1086]KAJ1748557.1 hypothetical protein LPJ79_004440 [Coemansia sp. RSA 1821]KAJ1867784.1 hypothetical protein LPJ78_000656 [Coemansia sp. RSA 989]KAJ1870361.1 hypothetical protein LPJ55_004712 [Coemansia sp. RSA 990]KAJ2673665.1 hypothetical protein IWW42_002077 [Coemansia sp. RSA 1085]
MVSLSARLKRSSLPPLSINAPPAMGSRPSYHARLAASGGVLSPGSPLRSSSTLGSGDASDELANDVDETLWHGVPVFDAGYWHSKGGVELVREKYSALHAKVEALTIVCTGSDETWHLECMSLPWPRAQVISIEYDAHEVQPDALALQWLYLAQNSALFPQAQMYRLKVRWAGCTEVFEHPLRDTLDCRLAGRLALLDCLPPLTGDFQQEMLFYKYRALFLVGVSFAMGTMSKSAASTLAMNAYITHVLKTDIFAPVSLELTDAQPQHLQAILTAINVNAHKLPYDQMRTMTSSTALQSSLGRICLDMHNMSNGRDRIIFCAAHFPQLASLLVRHSPDFRLMHQDPMDLGVLFSLPWPNLVELQLPFISDQYAKTLQSKCPALRFLYVLPEPRYERWTAYSQTFTPDGLHGLATRWIELRHLVVKYAFRNIVKEPVASPSRKSFGTIKRNTLSRAGILAAPSSISETAEAIPGAWPRESFTIYPKNYSLRVLRMPYQQLPFAVALAALVDAPKVTILEFAPLLRDPVTPSPGITSTLRRRVSMSPSPQLNAPFADSDVVYQLGAAKHPLESMILHGACSTRFITSSWIQIMNTFLRLSSVTFVATSQEDIAIATRIQLFCSRNNAAFEVDIDDQSRAFQTCLDFTTSWGRAEGAASAR